jgi:hypothetical protein
MSWTEQRSMSMGRRKSSRSRWQEGQGPGEEERQMQHTSCSRAAQEGAGLRVDAGT